MKASVEQLRDPDTVKIFAMLNAREDSWPVEVLSLYDQGASDTEVMREMDLTPEKWQKLEHCTYDSSFAETISLGRMMMRAWWESQGRKNLHNPKFNTTLYKTMMSNNFGWSDKSETSMTRLDFQNEDTTSLLRKITEMNEKLGLNKRLETQL